MQLSEYTLSENALSENNHSCVYGTSIPVYTGSTGDVDKLWIVMGI